MEEKNLLLSKGQHSHKEPCPECGSTDNLAVYWHEEEQLYSCSCWSPHCSFSNQNWTVHQTVPKPKKRDVEKDTLKLIHIRDSEAYMPQSLKDRKLTAETLEFYGVRTFFGQDGQCEAHYYPTYKAREHVGYKLRRRFKDYDREVAKKPHLLGKLKCFKGGVGYLLEDIEFFGQNLFNPQSYRKLYITGGELDAMTLYQASKTVAKSKRGVAAISAPVGENLKAFKTQVEWLKQWQEIVLCFDNDEAGRKAAKGVIELFGEDLNITLFQWPQKKTSKGGLVKDFSDWCCKCGMKYVDFASELYKSIWSVLKVEEHGVVTFEAAYKTYKETGGNVERVLFPDCCPELNEKTLGGWAFGDVLTITAASGAGKSTFAGECLYKALSSRTEKIAIISAEKDNSTLVQDLLSIHLSKRLDKLSEEEKDWAEIDKACEELSTMGYVEGAEEEVSDGKRLFIVEDIAGSSPLEKLKKRVNFAVKSLGCRIIFLDPFNMIVREDDMAEAANWVAGMAKNRSLAVAEVLHVRKNPAKTKANSEGADLAEEDIRGASEIFQGGAINMFLIRNKVEEDPVKKNTSRIKCTKIRRNGSETGTCGYLYYHAETGRMLKGNSPDEQNSVNSYSDFPEFGGEYEDFTEKDMAGQLASEW